MDATSAVPVELPDTSPISPPPIPCTSAPLPPIKDTCPADPYANLNSLGNEDGRPKYVNHWNQYRAMGSG